MRNIKWVSLAMGVLMIAVLACGGGGTTPTTVPPTAVPPTPRPTEETRPTSTPEVEETGSLEIINNSSVDIWYIYISPSDSNEWGDDWLGSATIPAGESYTIGDIPFGTYDLMAEDVDHNEITTETGVEIDGEMTWTLTDVGASEGSASLEIVNNSSTDVWYVYISPSDSDEWGDDWLGSTTVPAGESYTITGIDPGTYDLKAEDSDHNTLATEMGVEIDGETTWTLTDVGGGEEISQWATGAVASSEWGSDSWTAQQATGAPDTEDCGDYGSAWASSGTDTREWIELTYDTPVYVSEINIYQTYNPDQVVVVELIDMTGTTAEYHEVYTGDPATLDECPYVLSIPVQGEDYLAAGVRITIDQSEIQDWNEIDAVELIGVPE